MKRKGTKKKMLRRILLWLLLLVVLGGAGCYGYFMLKQEYTIVYDSYTATRGSISNALSFSGNLSLVDSASYAASAKGSVRNVYVAVGDSVREGQRLLRLSNGETIKAEFDGRVNWMDAEVDDEVAAGAQLVQIADFEHLKLTLRIDEYDIRDVFVGQKCRITITATEEMFESSIAFIDYISASGGSVAYYSATVYVDVPPSVYPGMQATVTVPQEEVENVVVLKCDALSFDERNQAFVYVRLPDDTMERRSVELGVSNGNYIEIKSGVDEGETVYVEAKQTASNPFEALMSGSFGGARFNQGGMQRGASGQGGFGAAGRDTRMGAQADWGGGRS